MLKYGDNIEDDTTERIRLMGVPYSISSSVSGGSPRVLTTASAHRDPEHDPHESLSLDHTCHLHRE